MSYYNRIERSEGIDPTKSTKSKECMICHYCFFNHGFNFQESIFNGCHDLTMLSVNMSHIAVINTKNVDYCCIINNIIKSEGINLLESSVPEDCGYIYKKIALRQFFLLFLF